MEPQPDPTEPPAPQRLVRRLVVARFDSRVSAELARSVLVDAGLDAHLSADDAGGLHPELSLVTGGVTLAVPAEDVEVAQALLTVPEGPGDDPRQPEPAGGATGTASPPSGSSRPGRLRRRRRRAALATAVAVVVLLVALALAVSAGGLLDLVR